MDKKAPSEFTRAFRAVLDDAMKKQVPMDFILMSLELNKIAIANQILSQSSAMQAHNLAQKISEVTPQIDPNKN